MPDQSWKSKFDEPVELPDGRKLRTLAEAIVWLAKEIPKSEHGLKSVQAAAHCITRAAEKQRSNDLRAGGNAAGDQPASGEEFDTSGKPHHWGKRKLRRDE